MKLDEESACRLARERSGQNVSSYEFSNGAHRIRLSDGKLFTAPEPMGEAETPAVVLEAVKTPEECEQIRLQRGEKLFKAGQELIAQARAHGYDVPTVATPPMLAETVRDFLDGRPLEERFAFWRRLGGLSSVEGGHGRGPVKPDGVMPFNATTMVPAGATVEISTEPQVLFYPHFLVGPFADDWIVNELIFGRCIVGLVSSYGELPGSVYKLVSFERGPILSPGTNVSICITNTSGHDRPFYAALLGEVMRDH